MTEVQVEARVETVEKKHHISREQFKKVAMFAVQMNNPDILAAAVLSLRSSDIRFAKRCLLKGMNGVRGDSIAAHAFSRGASDVFKEIVDTYGTKVFISAQHLALAARYDKYISFTWLADYNINVDTDSLDFSEWNVYNEAAVQNADLLAVIEATLPKLFPTWEALRNAGRMCNSGTFSWLVQHLKPVKKYESDVENYRPITATDVFDCVCEGGSKQLIDWVVNRRIRNDKGIIEIDITSGLLTALKERDVVTAKFLWGIVDKLDDLFFDHKYMLDTWLREGNWEAVRWTLENELHEEFMNDGLSRKDMYGETTFQGMLKKQIWDKLVSVDKEKAEELSELFD